MDIKQLSKWTDEQVFAKTGQHLNSLQKTILDGVLRHQSYYKIVDNNEDNYSYDYVKEQGAELWKLLSQVFEKDIKKKNVRSILENKAGSTVYNFINSPQINSNNISNSHVNICREPPQQLEDISNFSSTPQNKSQSPLIDLTKAPELNYNYDRNTEITTLKQWILENKTKLITIYGLSGIGKTALILKLIPEIQENFDYIIYRSLDNTPKLIDLKEELKHFFAQSEEKILPKVIDYFSLSRCLVILDDFHCIFKTGDLAGQYLPEFKDYNRFLQKIASLDHQSCLMVISWEKALRTTKLEADNHNIKTLHLQKLGEEAKKILKEKFLKDEDQWDKLITIYQGNPAWLNIISLVIKQYFNGSVSKFFMDQDELYLGEIEIILEDIVKRLSELEIQVINCLLKNDQCIDICQKTDNFELSKAKFLQIIQSLIRRCLLQEINQEEQVRFKLNSVFKDYYSRLD